jgi:small-conductance mechanosensitive channel
MAIRSKPTPPWIPLEKIDELVQLEPALVIVGLAVSAWLIYKLLLREVSPERHRNLSGLFKNLWGHAAISTVLFNVYTLAHRFLAASVDTASTDPLERLLSYIGLFTLLWGAIVFVKVARILLFEYLFLSHMKVAVPLLLVNLFTLLISIVIGGWTATEIFAIRLAPLLATSAIFSLVLGLALQDTLGNLFAGVALQFDKPYEIGDWIEINNGGPKWVGQVDEISWRATVLIGLADELITLPNRTMAQAQISNFSLRNGKPILRSQSFRVPYGTDIQVAKSALLRGAARCSRVRVDIAPLVITIEAAESWMMLKLIYFIDSYGAQFIIADEVINASLDELAQAGIKLAIPQIQLHGSETLSAACNPA